MPKVKLWDDLTPAQKVKRWEGVERVMKKLTPHQRKNHFCMSYWGIETSCGTIACVAGHCGLDASFRRQGFRLTFNGAFENCDGPQPLPFFGTAGHDGIFMKSDANYEQVRFLISEYLKELRAEAKRS